MEDLNRVILALDGMSLLQARELLAKVGKSVWAVKIHDLWDRHGPDIVDILKDAGASQVWADLKLHDIPQTVQLRTMAIVCAGARMISVHISGGVEMMKASLQLAGSFWIVGITVLTSLSEEEAHLTYGQPARGAVLNLARLAKLAGIHAVVCSPKEVGTLSIRPELRGLKFITAGIRSAGQDVADQKRVDTPYAAIKAGADFLVIGREVTKAVDPIAALENINQQIVVGLEERSKGK